MGDYKLLLGGKVILRLKDGAMFPRVADNIDYQAYLKWEAAGNTPDPEFTPEELAEKQKADEAAAREKLIAEKMRELAISELKKEGKLPPDYKVDQK